MDTDSPYMTVQETRRFLRLSRKTIYKLLESGAIPGVKIGDVWRIDKIALGQKLASNGVV